MKIAHFTQFAPHACGQYETVRDIIKAERAVGIEAELIDYGKKGGECNVGKRDGHITTAHPDFAKQADILFHHSAVPPSIEKQGKPIVLCLHGRPESTFKIGFQNEKTNLIQLVLNCAKKPNYVAIITFWEEFLFVWKNIIPEEEKLHYIPITVDLERYNPTGEKRKLSKDGSPQLMITDLWREDITPFNTIFSALYYKTHCQPEAVINVYGLPSKKNRAFLDKLHNDGAFGDFFPPVTGLEKIYRSMDLLLTPHTIAVRTVREALASGLPIIAGSGNQYTEFKGNANDIFGFAIEINRAWGYLQEDRNLFKINARKMAEKNFNSENTGLSIRELVTRILS